MSSRPIKNDEDEITELEARIEQEDKNFKEVNADLELLAEHTGDPKQSFQEQRLADIKLVLPFLLEVISDLIYQLEELTGKKEDVSEPNPNPNLDLDLDLEERYEISRNTINLLHKKILIELKKKEEHFSNEEKIVQLKLLLELKQNTIADLHVQKKELKEELKEELEEKLEEELKEKADEKLSMLFDKMNKTNADGQAYVCEMLAKKKTTD
jgi:hypothetical protein